ncbi:Transcription initiation factor TFIID subunit 7 [Channa argus]|uniref:Transcription initiation factor TFIID subunit 7 n=1 Tax=Channa argus TaxID=215402 RepID=A0A6G1PUV7_CHAAH|nr:Transcription initiation factor TFIID subunit 7 [Channa argus]
MTSKLKVGKVGSKNKEDAPYELESQFVLRLPLEYASTVRRIAQSGSMNMKDRLTIELHPDGRHGIVRVDRVPLACKLVDLPCMIESLKTVDKKTFYKTADVCQMLVCTLDGDLYPPLEEPTGTDPKTKKKDKDKDKKFVWNHGIKAVPVEYRSVFTLQVDFKERWEVIAEDESKEADQHGSLANLDSSPGTSGHKMGHGSSAQRDELREIFNDISSSSEDEEDEGDRHEDEDLNIMDTEDDLVRQLQDKLNESDSGHNESDRNNHIVMEYQVQINNVKAKLQDTRARKKQQEELIMKVENQALKNRFQALLDEIIQQEEREMEQLVFHFQTLLDNFERTVIDDSRQAGRLGEIFVGKMFKMEVWETLLTSMRVGEVAEFWCDAIVGDPMSYHRESWMMEKDEKLQTVPILHMQGNTLVKQGEFREAASKYKEAVLLLKTVQSRVFGARSSCSIPVGDSCFPVLLCFTVSLITGSKEMPGDIDYINLGRMIIPLELNYCQCMLELEEYYEVIEHTSELLEKHKDCVKGYYKRAKAHAAVWNEKEARRDFNMVAQLDITLASLVKRELRALSERMKEKYWEERERYWNMLEKNDNKSDEEEKEEKGKQEDGESVTTESKAEVRDDKVEEESASKGEPGGKEENVEQAPAAEAGNKEKESCAEIKQNVLDKTEGKDWQQMLRLVMLLQNEGNFLIKEKRFEDASAKFKEALEYVDFLQNTADQQDEDWESLEKVRLPLTLNLSQCMLELKQYQKVVELNSKLLKKHKGNFKAVYQRARAHVALCNEDEARRDFDMVEKLDPKFKPFVRKELKKLCESMRTMHALQNKTYWDTTWEKWGPDGSKAKSAARKKNAKFTQKATKDKSEADKKSHKDEIEEKESSEKSAPAETEEADDAEAEENTDVKAEQSNKVVENVGASQERVDNENTECVVVHGDGQGAPDNRTTDKDSNPVPTSTGKDNVVCKGSACDKGRKKVKCQSSAAQGPSETSQGNKATRDKNEETSG